MRSTSVSFRQNSVEALLDPDLQKALGKMGFLGARQRAVDALPEWEQIRSTAREIKEHTLAHLDFYLQEFEANVEAQGGHVHWCSTPEEACTTVVQILRDSGARTVTKGKSMAGEEIGLNEALADATIDRLETDLGEYIIQLADEPPSHIIAPAIHKTKDQITELFHEHHQKHGKTEPVTDVGAIVNEAREVLRDGFLSADAGITGANFLVAETGSIALVTNEGNGDLTNTLPRVHIVTAGMEKVIPTLDDLSVFLRLLARSATGQEMSVYTTLVSGAKRGEDQDGPEEFHVVLIDNGRSQWLGNEFHEMLRCIRCGACQSTCPVYGAVGGHAYGSVYGGPIGAVLTPALNGIENAWTLPEASSFCGACEAVCPMQIPLPSLMRKWRDIAHRNRLNKSRPRLGLALWAWTAKRPRLYRTGARLVVAVLKLFAGNRGRFRSMPLAGGWTTARDLPAPEGGTFIERWQQKRGP